MVKNAKAKRAAREYQLAHPGMSYSQARQESREEYERSRSSTRASTCDEHEGTTPSGPEWSEADDIRHPIERPLPSHYLTNPFGLKPNDNAEQT
ncbi:hypothetical protein SAMN02799620_05366 [Mycolicibacterium fluoranthenivorans]|uniref:Uncharacterized protein n=1 Tax=Mycolicibacterium fluoranthenivorans TaxID=258505 RepID=A0A1G4WX48_9MYCO|nr:hypothetical protein SAMN02799620_05366 [Mycolicibacterium fluoranthenivorans]